MLFVIAFFLPFLSFFFFNAPPTTEIYTLSLHDALPIYHKRRTALPSPRNWTPVRSVSLRHPASSFPLDRKSTRLNSSHLVISYAVFCLKKKKQHQQNNLNYQNL